MSSEHLEQVTAVNWFRKEYPKCLIFAVPNGDLRAVSVAQRLKHEGVTAGIPDLCIIFENGKTVWIEMKKTKGGVISSKQKEIHSKMRELHQTVIVCNGFLEFQENIYNLSIN